MTRIYARTVVHVEGIGNAVVTTLDFLEPGYKLCGFESQVRLPDGMVWGCGPDYNESPEVLHAINVDAAQIAKVAARFHDAKEEK